MHSRLIGRELSRDQSGLHNAHGAACMLHMHIISRQADEQHTVGLKLALSYCAEQVLSPATAFATQPRQRSAATNLVHIPVMS